MFFSKLRNKCLCTRFRFQSRLVFWQCSLISIGLKRPSACTFDPISTEGPCTWVASIAFIPLYGWGDGGLLVGNSIKNGRRPALDQEKDPISS